MMAQLVYELQRAALDQSLGTPDLLRRALMVAQKLKVQKFSEWLAGELEGYGTGQVPSYRVVHGLIHGKHPMRGWIPVMIPNSLLEAFGKRGCHQSVAELEVLAKSSAGKGFLQMPLLSEIQEELGKLTGRADIQYTLKIPASRIAGILDSVKTAVLSWALKLERDGILGEEFSFSNDEISKAQQNSLIILGDIYGAQIQQGSNHSRQLLKRKNIDQQVPAEERTQ